MGLINNLNVLLGRKRWTKRIFKNYMNDVAFKKIRSEIKFHYCPKDLEGPSFHFGYDLEKGFMNYEYEDKEKLCQMIPSEGVFYDIGANIGMFSVYISSKRRDVKVYSFEPERKVFTCLKKTVEQSGLENVRCFNVGVGFSNEEEVPLYVCGKNDGGHSLIRNDSHNLSEEDCQKISLINLKDFIQKNNLEAPDVIKVDVEGFEATVLKGLFDLIKEYRPYLLVECRSKDLMDPQSELSEILKSFEDLGFTCTVKKSHVMKSVKELSDYASSLFHRGQEHENYLLSFKA